MTSPSLNPFQPAPGTSSGLTCVCTGCGQQFRLDSADRPGPDRTSVQVDACDSGGMYGMTVTCPRCRHVHDLW